MEEEINMHAEVSRNTGREERILWTGELQSDSLGSPGVDYEEYVTLECDAV
jgi:hypothetical protein